MTNLIATIQQWLADPTVAKLIALGIGILLIHFVFRVLSRSLPRYIQDSDTRYRIRKVITFVGYFFILLYATIVFSDRLGRLTVVFGVVGAGVAFALQEVISSFAGWVAISLGQFYKPAIAFS